jgi:hypothetical protein
MSDQQVIDRAAEKAKGLADPEVLSFLTYIQEYFMDVAGSVEMDRVKKEIEFLRQSAIDSANGAFMVAHQAWSASATGSIADEEEPSRMDFVVDNDALIAPLEEKLAELRARVIDSKIVFNLRGVKPYLQTQTVQALYDEVKELPEDERDEFIRETLGDRISVLAVESIEIPAQNRKITGDQLDAKSLGSIVNKLTNADSENFYEVVRMLNVATAVVDTQVDAGFPGGADDPAAEPGVPDAATDV